MAQPKDKRLKEASQAGTAPSARTHLLGALAGGAVLAVFGAEVTRVWRLGMLPRSREEASEERPDRGRFREALTVLREGYAVSRTRENSLFNMLASFTVAFATTRAITVYIREHGGLGPIQDVMVGDRHIHHFIPGGLLSLASGGVAIGTKGEKLDKYLAFPFGVGVALVLDESALLLELEDVYWTEEGILSLQITLTVIALMGALAVALRLVRRGEEIVLEPPAPPIELARAG
jgi:hypothetical protein